MGSDIDEEEYEYVMLLLVYKEHIRTDMALTIPFELTPEFVVSVFFGKLLPEASVLITVSIS